MKHNPNVKTNWTQEQMDLIAEQIDKYHRVAQGERARDVFVRDDHCLICGVCDFGDCQKCPLSNGREGIPCAKEPTYIHGTKRECIDRKQARVRRDYLVRRINESGAGIEIYFE